EIVLIPPESLLGPQSEIPKVERMRVKSIFATEFQEIDTKLMLFQLGNAPLRFQSAESGESGLEVRMRQPDEFGALKEELLRELAAQGARDYKIETWADRNHALFLALRLEKIAMTTFLGLSVLITCFSLITVLVM